VGGCCCGDRLAGTAADRMRGIIVAVIIIVLASGE
jgi:hypothetical protein